MKVISNSILFFLLISMFSCKDEAVTSDPDTRIFEYKEDKWKSKSKVQHVDEIKYAATEVPNSYYIKKAVGEQYPNKLDSIIEASNDERIIEFEFRHDEEKELLNEEVTKIDYATGVKYISFEIEKDFYAVTSENDTIKCSGIAFERNYKIAPYQKILLFFSGIKSNEQLLLVYNDRLFGKGILKFRLKDNITKLSL